VCLLSKLATQLRLHLLLHSTMIQPESVEEPDAVARLVSSQPCQGIAGSVGIEAFSGVPV
jgi:hypothetical protein